MASSNPAVHKSSLATDAGHTPIAGAATSLNIRSSPGRAVAEAGRISEYLDHSSKRIIDAIRVALEGNSQDGEYFGESRMKQGVLREVRSALGSTVLQGETWDSLEVDKLLLEVLGCESVMDINRSGKTMEAAALVQSICDLPTDVAVIRLRSDAAKELSTNKTAREAVRNLLDNTSFGELSAIIDGPKPFESRYAWYHRIRDASRELAKLSSKLPVTGSELLNTVFDDLREFKNTEVARHLLHGSTFTLDGVMPSSDVAFKARGFRFWPYPIDPVIAVLGAATAATAGWGAITGSVPATEHYSSWSLFIGSMSLALATVGAMVTKRMVDGGFVMKPLEGKALRDLPRVFNAICILRELTALNSFFDKAKIPTTQATPIESSEVMFVADGMGSPLHATHSNFVLNSCAIGSNEITVLSGPNSGGKTTWIKSTELNLMLCQLVGRCFAHNAKFSPATRIGFTVPKQNFSSSSEGRFGEELTGIAEQLTIDVGPKTILGIDEIGSGTSESAATPVALPILETMQFCGMRVILASHNNNLLDSLERKNLLVKPLHPEGIVEKDPSGQPTLRLTRRILDGRPPPEIDPSLYARGVANRVGVDESQLQLFREEWLANRAKS